MIIHDLTRGKYPALTRFYISKDEVSSQLKDTGILQAIKALYNIELTDITKLIDDIPVFLVESSMANEWMPIPGQNCSICVPSDFYIANVADFNAEEWLDSLKDPKNDPREWVCKGHVLCDLFGVYIYEGKDCVIPCRIFIWADKIEQWVKENSRNERRRNAEELIAEESRELYCFVLYHEVMHALMDVNAYGVPPCPLFDYCNPIYRFMEEALANYLALIVCGHEYNGCSAYHNNVFSFVRGQEEEYRVGLDLFIWREIIKKGKSFIRKKVLLPMMDKIVCKWMEMKSHLNYERAELLVSIWENCKAAQKQYDEDDTFMENDLAQARAEEFLRLVPATPQTLPDNDD